MRRRHLAVGFSNRKDTAYPVHIDSSVGLGVSERTKLFSDGGKFWMSDGDKGVGRCGTADGCSCGSGYVGPHVLRVRPHRPCRCREPRPCWLRGMLVLAGDAAEAVVSADVERDESVGFERLREREQGGRRLGGAGVGHAAKHNLVTQTSNPTNSLYQRGLIEDKIYRAVDDRDEVIQYDITPIYGGANSVPVRLEYSAYGNKGFELTGWLDTPAPAPRHPTARDSSVGGPMLWSADEPWPVCAIPHKRSSGFRYTEVMRKREILEQARRRDARSGPTAGEIEIIDGFKRGRHAPHLADTRHNLHVRLLRRHSEDIGTPLTEHPVPEAVGREELVPAPCVLHPEDMVEHPYLEALAPPCRPVSTYGRGQRTTKARSTSTTCPRPPAGRSADTSSGTSPGRSVRSAPLRESSLHPGCQAAEQGGGFGALVVLRPLQPLRVIKLTKQCQQIYFALRHSHILACELHEHPHGPSPSVPVHPPVPTAPIQVQ